MINKSRKAYNRKNQYFLLALAVGQMLSAQPNRTVREFVPFEKFMSDASAASAHVVREQSAKVKNAEAFEEMRGHLMKLYSGVHVTHSFVENANHFDCLPVNEQPSVRAMAAGKKVASAPPAAMLQQQTTGAQTVTDGAADEFGNAMTCEAGTVPMRRVTLEEMTQFSSVKDFLSKRPEEAAPATTASPAHKYSHAAQTVDNIGGNSSLNLWRPYVDTTRGEVFSLMQQWWVGGSGSGLQTAEVGWQNYPKKYGTQNSVLFLYWTADGYSKTGCYNLDCPGFVQVDNSIRIGGSFTNYSTTGGTQHEFSAMFYLYEGNWWLAIEGIWVGYIDGSVYGNGQMSQNAQVIDFGTESVGTTVWPGEGSGAWSTSGWSNAAYQRNVYYFDVNGDAYWSTLRPITPSPHCYSVNGPLHSTSSGWELYLFFGGPGGTGC